MGPARHSGRPRRGCPNGHQPRRPGRAQHARPPRRPASGVRLDLRGSPEHRPRPLHRLANAGRPIRRDPSLNEIAVVFGAERHLVGTLTLPTDTTAQPVAFLLSNAGVIHRIGPHRFNVKLARQLAKGGFTSLRFDLSGQGDSRAPTQAESFERQNVADLRAAMDHLERVCGIKRFVIAGICSGAHNGLATALADPRVAGLWMMDGYTYSTPKTNRVRYQQQLKGRFFGTLGSWALKALRMVTSRLLPGGAKAQAKPATAVVDYGFTTPPREAFAASMQALVDRGVNIFMVYSGSMLWYYNHASQFRDAFAAYPFAKTVRCDYVPHIDHTVTTLAAQRELLKTICDWATTVRA
ncbi:MAG: alpha/beta fold hydrolase [Rubrivivax sp.]|nr:MAG: alpha/beta fold hydrolase [Rubrivivax sp.]